jgi:hypothetical protein
MEARHEAGSSTFKLKVEDAAALWPEESARAETLVNLQRPCRADAVATSERLQQGVCHRVCRAAKML